MIKNLQETVLHKVCKVSFNSATPKIECFSKGVWGIRLPLHLLAVAGVVSKICCLLQCKIFLGMLIFLNDNEINEVHHLLGHHYIGVTPTH